jgi:hypothetical protein
MNQPTRAKRLEAIIVKRTEVTDLLDTLTCELEESWGNIEGTNLANTEKNQRLEENATNLRDLTDDLGNGRDSLAEITL